MTSSRSGAGTGRHEATRKAFDAFLLWRWYSREIEADLQRFYRVDIRDWYRGEVDSRRLLALIAGLPDESLFSTWAVRAGDWSPTQYVNARLVNEVALSRADGKGYTPNLLKSPAQLADEQFESEYRSRRHEENLQQLVGEESHGDHR